MMRSPEIGRKEHKKVLSDFLYNYWWFVLPHLTSSNKCSFSCCSSAVNGSPKSIKKNISVWLITQPSKYLYGNEGNTFGIIIITYCVFWLVLLMHVLETQMKNKNKNKNHNMRKLELNIKMLKGFSIIPCWHSQWSRNSSCLLRERFRDDGVW